MKRKKSVCVSFRVVCVIFSRRNNNNGDGRERRSLVGVGRRVGDVVDRRQTVRRLSNRSVLSFLFRFLLLFGWLVGLHILAGPAARLLLGYVVVIFKRGQVIFITEHKQQGRRRPFSFRELLLLLGCSIKEQKQQQHRSTAQTLFIIILSPFFLLLLLLTLRLPSPKVLVTLATGRLLIAKAFARLQSSRYYFACLCFLLLLLLLLYSSSSSTAVYSRHRSSINQKASLLAVLC